MSLTRTLATAAKLDSMYIYFAPVRAEPARLRIRRAPTMSVFYGPPFLAYDAAAFDLMPKEAGDDIRRNHVELNALRASRDAFCNLSELREQLEVQQEKADTAGGLLRTTLRDNEAAAHKLTEATAALEHARQEAASERAAWAATLRGNEDTLHSKAAECVRLGGRTMALTEERDDLAAKNAALRRELTALQLAHSNALRRNKQTPAEDAQRKPAQAASKADGSAVEKRAEAAQRKLLDAQNELAMAQGNNEGLQHRLETAQAENRETKVQLRQAEDKLDAVKGIVVDSQTAELPVLQVLRTFKMLEHMMVRRRSPTVILNPFLSTADLVELHGTVERELKRINAALCAAFDIPLPAVLVPGIAGSESDGESDAGTDSAGEGDSVPDAHSEDEARQQRRGQRSLREPPGLIEDNSD